MKILNVDLQKLAEENRNKYEHASPFPHIYFDNFFNSDFLDVVLSEFPDLSKKKSQKYNNANEIKLAGNGEQFFEKRTKQLMHYLNSQEFLLFLQELTGIKETLLGDPYFVGGGQHEIKKGGLLKIHADFNKHNRTNLDRRLNVLIYLNKDWKEEYGGHFELWDKDMTKAEQKILPIFNRVAIFTTTDFSYHGHPEALNCPEFRSRKSLALYYYSNGRPLNEINDGLEDHTTLFKARKGVANDVSNFSKIKLIDFVPPILTKIYRRLK